VKRKFLADRRLLGCNGAGSCPARSNADIGRQAPDPRQHDVRPMNLPRSTQTEAGDHSPLLSGTDLWANFACRENAAGVLNLLLCFPHSI